MKRLALLLAVLLLLTGCTPLTNADELDLVEDWEDFQQMIPEPVEEEPEPEPEYPTTFSLPYHRDHPLDPVTCPEGLQDGVVSLMFEPLFRLNGKFQPEPMLCESWEWNETGLICTLTLREGVTFSDGSALTARDVVETLLRAKESERYAYRLRNVAAIAANRAGRVLITLTTPDQGLPALLDIPIVKRGTEAQAAPIGTGPYLLVNDGDGSCLQAREGWWRQKALPLDTIPLAHVKDQDTALYLFSSRRIELMTVDPTDDPSLVTGKAQAVSQPTSIMQFIGFNTAEGRVFSNAALRSLFSQGIDRETLVHAQLAQLALAAQFPISPLSELYPADLEKAYNEDETLTALQAIEQTEEGPLELTLLVSGNDSFRVTSAQYIADHLSVLGWNITVADLPWEEYLAALEAGDFDLYFGEVRLTADWDLTDLVGTEGLLNYGGFTDETTDQLLLDFAAAEDRTLAARRLMVSLQTNVPIAPVCFMNYSVLTHPDVVEGMSPAPGSVFYNLENWTIHLKEDASE